MEKIVNKNIPVIFQNIEQFEKGDSRFVKVKIWLLHLNENLNGSIFTKESVEKALPTLSNTPILAFLEENSEGELDYSDHRMVLHRKEDGDVGIKYLGQAIGLIPETNNAQWEKRITDSGDELEYLTVEGLLWTKWDDPIDIIKRKGITAQSMELSDDYSGHWNDDGYFVFDRFSFFGACLLGTGVMPAMKNSTAELQFSSNNDMRKIIEDKLNEFNTLFSKGGTNQVENNQQEFETTVETKESQVEEAQAEFTEEVIVETEESNENQEIVTEEFTEETQAETVEETEEVVEEIQETATEETVVEEEQVVNEFEVKFNNLSTEFEAIQAELAELRDFKRNTLEAELSAKFEGQLSTEELTQVFEQSKTSTIEDIEKELFALVGKKNFSLNKAEKKEKNAIAFNINKEVKPDSPYGDFFK